VGRYWSGPQDVFLELVGSSAYYAFLREGELNGCKHSDLWDLRRFDVGWNLLRIGRSDTCVRR